MMGQKASKIAYASEADEDILSWCSSHLMVCVEYINHRKYKDWISRIIFSIDWRGFHDDGFDLSFRVSTGMLK